MRRRAERLGLVSTYAVRAPSVSLEPPILVEVGNGGTGTITFTTATVVVQ
jgi:hypothetical protein